MSSIAFLCGIPQGAAGPESGVEIPNLTASAARPLPVLAAINAAAPRSADQFGENPARIFASRSRGLCSESQPDAGYRTMNALVNRSAPKPFVGPVSDEGN